MDRRFLVETLEQLLTDEYDSSEVVYYTDEEIILRIIEAAEYYKNECTEFTELKNHLK